MSELASLVVFCLLAVVILGTALGVVLSNNLVHSALLMTACFIGVGIMYHFGSIISVSCQSKVCHLLAAVTQLSVFLF